eukprot:GHVU01089231.1.p1 GENE.GHVU01089231.1~~GHVU01089231.1.p1  ORF type:complete len:182 (-),score=26.86 GHVU01089231.1:469-1014(-)
MTRSFSKLIDMGIYSRVHFLNERDKEGRNLLHLAAIGRSVKVVHGMWEVLKDDVKHLLEQEDKHGETPLDIANNRGPADMVHELEQMKRVTANAAIRPVPPPRRTKVKIPELAVVRRKSGSAIDVPAPTPEPPAAAREIPQLVASRRVAVYLDRYSRGGHASHASLRLFALACVVTAALLR